MTVRRVIDITVRELERNRRLCLIITAYLFAIAGLFLSSGLTSPRTVAVTQLKMPPSKFYDPSTFSNPDAWQTTYMKLHLDVDFKRHIIDGIIELNLRRVMPATENGNVEDGNSPPARKVTKNLYLDTYDLTIKKVYVQNDHFDSLTEVEHKTTSTAKSGFGQALEIMLDGVINGDTHISLTIEYSTSANSSGLVWLEPEQTAGQKHPYVYSHSEAIHSRAIFPCQDTPSVKAPYDVEITVPEPLVALVSGLPKDKPRSVSGNRRTFSYTMPHPVPVYLLAFAVGNIEVRSIGPRSRVWSEPELVDRAAAEFDETEEMLKAAENICGPYVWHQYDILVLPPSFPFGGMENPCLTFATPTLLAGDKSLANVIAHEIAHSWTGNLITNYNWEHFWLNEGFTVFVERKILARLKGGGEEGEKHRHFAAIIGYRDLKDAVDRYGATHPLTCLVPDLSSTNPDDSFSAVPYEKGHTFLFYLEQLVGPLKFEDFLRSWIREYQFKTATSEDFHQYFEQHFGNPTTTQNDSTLKQIDWDAWFKQPGMPIVEPKYDQTLAQACTKLREKWQTFNDLASINNETFPPDEFQQALTSSQKIEFLGQLLQTFDNNNMTNSSSSSLPPIKLEKLEKMRQQYGELDKTQNAEVKFRWLRLQIKCESEAAIEPALQFAGVEQGRMKFSRPLFRDLYLWQKSRERALKAYADNKQRMAYVAANQIAKDLNLLPTGASEDGKKA